MTFSMAFDRKWVSDSSLDKLWNDTIEKKVANKQRRSPDFCKEAILSATLQRISSEMLTRRLSSPMVGNGFDSDDDDEDTLTFLSSVSSLMECEENLPKVFSNCSGRFAEDQNESMITSTSNSNIKQQNSNVVDNLNETSKPFEMSDADAVGRSPKRRWSDTDDNTDQETSNLHNPVACSPAKRPRAKSKIRDKSSKCPDHCEQTLQIQTPASRIIKNELASKIKKRHFTLPKVKIIPADEDVNVTQKVEVNNSLLSPVRSVVNSISELSIEVNDALPPRENFWCLPVASNKVDDDPLELDDFFSNLKKVKS